MKRLILVVTAVLVLGIMSCVPTSQPDIETITPTTEPEPEETPLDMHWIGYRTRLLSEDISDLYNRYQPWTFDGGKTLKFPVPSGCHWAWIEVTDLKEAKIHIENASSLANRGSLPTEQIGFEEVNPEEIAYLVEASMSILLKKMTYIYALQGNIIAEMKQQNILEMYIIDCMDFFDYYLRCLAGLIEEHELILSKLH